MIIILPSLLVLLYYYIMIKYDYIIIIMKGHEIQNGGDIQ
jgi:hypothetical protein